MHFVHANSGFCEWSAIFTPALHSTYQDCMHVLQQIMSCLELTCIFFHCFTGIEGIGFDTSQAHFVSVAHYSAHLVHCFVQSNNTTLINKEVQSTKSGAFCQRCSLFCSPCPPFCLVQQYEPDKQRSTRHTVRPILPALLSILLTLSMLLSSATIRP